MKGRRPLLIAHRGSSGSAPENTFAAFQRAIKAGVDMIELDVRMTSDFHLVIHHDKTLRRTTNGSGFIWNHTLAELRMLDAGSWFSPQFTGERIPTLREVMEMLPPQIGLNIEVKTDGDPRRRHGLAESVILIILEKRFQERVIVSSFNHTFLRRLEDLFPAIPTGALYLPVRDIRKTPSTLHRTLGTTAFICNRSHLRKRHVENAHANNMWVASYSINTRAQLEKALRYEVDAVVTDYPDRLKRLLTDVI